MRMRHGSSWELLLERLGRPGQRQHCKSASRHRGDGPTSERRPPASWLASLGFAAGLEKAAAACAERRASWAGEECGYLLEPVVGTGCSLQELQFFSFPLNSRSH